MGSREPQEAMNTSRPVVIAYVPALIGALLSVFCTRLGVLGILFLFPLGTVAFVYQDRTPWFCLFLTILGNSILSFWMGLSSGSSFKAIGEDILYFSVMTTVFTWITAPPVSGPRLFRIQGVCRVAAASLLGALSLVPVMRSINEDGSFQIFLQAQAELIASLYTSSSTSLAGQNTITPETIARLLNATAVRGGAAASCFVLLVFSRQFALLLSWFFLKKRFDRQRFINGLFNFHVPFRLIWLLSASLLGVLLGVRQRILPVEIAAWNMLVICIILYLIQGVGVASSLIYRLSVSILLRSVLMMTFFGLMLYPGINAILLVFLVILGIADNWASFRTLKTNRPSSTPGA